MPSISSRLCSDQALLIQWSKTVVFERLVDARFTSDTVFPEAFRGGPALAVFPDSGPTVVQQDVGPLSRERLKPKPDRRKRMGSRRRQSPAGKRSSPPLLFSGV